MLYTVSIVLIILWLLGIVSSHAMRGFIHVLLDRNRLGAGADYHRQKTTVITVWPNRARQEEAATAPYCPIDEAFSFNPLTLSIIMRQT